MEFEIVEELPAGGRGNVSDYDVLIQTYITAVDGGIVKNINDAGNSVWTVIKKGDNKESLAAATSQLKDKYGDKTCRGLSFACRPYVADTNLTAIYLCYEPETIVEGHAAEHDAKRKARIKALNERAAAKKAEAKANPTPTTLAVSEAGSTATTKKG